MGVVRAIVYGVMAELSAWRWCVSVALQADAVWWRRRGAERIWIAGAEGSACSLGQSFAQRERLEAVRAAGPTGQGRWVDWREAAGGWEADIPLYERMLQSWEGRLLLPEEIESLLVSEDIGRFDAGQWLPYAQLGALDGRVRLSNGLRPEPPPAGSGWWRRVAKKEGLSRKWNGFRCVRCGSGSESLHEVHCPVCGESCPYCEACLTMGRVRYCSLLLQGVRHEPQSLRGVDSGRAAGGFRAISRRRESVVNAANEQAATRQATRGAMQAEVSAAMPLDVVALEPSTGKPAVSAASTASERAGRSTTLPLTKSDANPDGSSQQWDLSPAQAEASAAALRFLDEDRERTFLLWAVTGAGKTEMMFPLIERIVSRGGRALVATPRKDVVLELAPRCRTAFPAFTVVAWYGGSEERWRTGQISLSTTHQLFRYREAFDLVVLDEVDAFPFHGDPQLAFAAERACAAHGKFVLLSATPPRELRKLAERGRLPHAKVCARFHRHPLPVPIRLAVPPMRRWAERALPRSLRAALERSLNRGAQLFVFVPLIARIEPLVRLLGTAFPEAPVGGASSRDEARGEKVEMFRDRRLRIIVTTTILERGVTVPKTDVFVLDADSPLFDGASLVQMAGRAGRKNDDPKGNVWFCSAEWTAGQREAVRDIRSMNSLARRKGYLIEE